MCLFCLMIYKELVKLALLHIEIQPLCGITLQRPGSVSKARLMSKVIYALKIILLSKQNSLQTIIDTTCLKKLKCFVDFCINFYNSLLGQLYCSFNSPRQYFIFRNENMFHDNLQIIKKDRKEALNLRIKHSSRSKLM